MACFCHDCVVWLSWLPAVLHPRILLLWCCLRFQAVIKFNLQRVLSDPSGEQDRPLVVRRANMRKPSTSPLLGQPGLQSAAAGLSANSAFSSGSNVGATVMSIGSGPLTAMDLQSQGSLSQLGLAPQDVPLYLQPLMVMQVRCVCGCSLSCYMLLGCSERCSIYQSTSMC